MGLYSHYIFPRLMDWFMAGEEFRRLRTDLLREAHGTVLELGIGTGLNVPHYPAQVTELYAVDPANILPQRIGTRVTAAPFPVRVDHVTAEMLPYGDQTFDTVVSTWTLCTIPDPVLALREVGRVLKPGGRFLFLEHGRSDSHTIAMWQDRLNSIQNVIGCGCNLNRQIDHIITQAGLKISQLDRFTMKAVPRLGGEMYRGIAVKGS